MEAEGLAIRSRRKHSSEFKAEVIKACRQPGASIRSVALARGLNPSLVRHWLASRGTGASANVARPALQPLTRAASGFVALGIENEQPAVASTIRLEMRRRVLSQ